MKIIKTDDSKAAAQLAMRLWEGHTEAELCEEFDRIISGENAAVFLAYENGAPVGFA